MVIGVDIGGTKVATGVVDINGRVLRREERPSRAYLGAEVVLGTVTDLVAELRGEFPEATSVGVGTPGLIDGDKGVVLECNANLVGFRGLELRDRLQARLPDARVRIENDVNLAALGEARFGVGREARSLIMVLIGTGIGGAMVFGGNIYRGVRGIGGELGHMPITAKGGRPCSCGRRGCIEAYAGGAAISKEYGRRRGGEGLSVQELALRASNGDTTASQILRQAGAMLGRHLGGIVNLLNPDMLVLGGGVTQVGERYLSPLKTALRAHAIQVSYEDLSIRSATLGQDAVLIGAAILAQQPRS